MRRVLPPPLPSRTRPSTPGSVSCTTSTACSAPSERSIHHVADSCGSESTTRTRIFSPRIPARFTVVVLFPTPPLPFATVSILKLSPPRRLRLGLVLAPPSTGRILAQDTEYVYNRLCKYVGKCGQHL